MRPSLGYGFTVAQSAIWSKQSAALSHEERSKVPRAWARVSNMSARLIVDHNAHVLVAFLHVRDQEREAMQKLPSSGICY
jgi:hypothetical protein